MVPRMTRWLTADVPHETIDLWHAVEVPGAAACSALANFYRNLVIGGCTVAKKKAAKKATKKKTAKKKKK